MSSNFKIGISFAPSKILSKELIPPKSKKDNAVKIETKEINCVLISFEILIPTFSIFSSTILSYLSSLTLNIMYCLRAKFI